MSHVTKGPTNGPNDLLQGTCEEFESNCTGEFWKSNSDSIQPNIILNETRMCKIIAAKKDEVIYLSIYLNKYT